MIEASLVNPATEMDVRPSAKKGLDLNLKKNDLDAAAKVFAFRLILYIYTPYI